MQLPCRLDGQRLEHLSASSYRLFVECPEAWRRRYIAGERSPKNAGMVIGSRVDDALTDYYRHQLEHGEQLPAEEVLDRYQQRWSDLLNKTPSATRSSLTSSTSTPPARSAPPP